jgi:hypothetical protein
MRRKPVPRTAAIDPELSELRNLDFDVRQAIEGWYRAISVAGAECERRVSVSIKDMAHEIELLEAIRGALGRYEASLAAQSSVPEPASSATAGQPS